MNVAIFINNLSATGGTEVVSKEYALRLLSRNDKIFFITASYDTEVPEFEGNPNVNVFNVNAVKSVLSEKDMESILKYCTDFKIDRSVFILNQPRRSGAMSNLKLIVALSKITIMEVVFHNSPKSYLKRYWHGELGFFGNILRFVKTKFYVAPDAKRFMRCLHNNNISIYTICKGCQKEMHDYFGLESRIRYNTYSFIEKNIWDKKNVVTYCGRLEVEKNVLMLLKAWKMTNTEGWIFRIIGDGTEKQLLMNYCKKNSITNVEFIGSISHIKVYDYLAESRLFLLASTNEGFPTVVVEAMNMGNAIITTKFDGISDELISLENSIIAPYNYRGYAKSLGLLLKNPELLSQKGAAAFNRCKNFYSSKEYLDRLD